MYTLLHEILLTYHVNQCDETPVQVVNDNDPDDSEDHKGAAGHKNYMWVHRSENFVSSQQFGRRQKIKAGKPLFSSNCKILTDF